MSQVWWEGLKMLLNFEKRNHTDVMSKHRSLAFIMDMSCHTKFRDAKYKKHLEQINDFHFS